MHKYTLQNLIHINNGMDYRHLEKGSIPVYGSGGYMTSVDQFLHEGESILLPRKGSLDNIMFVDGKFWTVDTMYWATVNTKLVNAYYLYNLLKILDFAGVRSGSTLPSMTSSAYYNIPVTLPDVKVQDSIANILKGINSKIELNDKINTELETIAKDLYNYWFVQFDFPDKDKRPYKSSGGKMIYNDVLKREIPEGWTVENIADNRLSKILKPGIKQFDGQKIYLPTAAVENDRIIDKSNLITYDNREGRANMEPVDNSVWFAKMKNTKKVLYFGDYSSQRISQTILSTGMLGLKCVENALEYIWNFVNDDFFEAVKNKLSHGATQEGVNNDDLLYFPMLIPSIETLRDYSVLVKDLYKQKYFNEIENECLAELRDFLLPMLMNGQVSVS